MPTGRGWYQDGTDGSLKINSDVYADVNVAVYGFSKPSTDPCLGVLSSTLYARDLTTGNSLLVGEQRRASSRAWTSWEASRASRSFSGPGTSLATPPVLVQVTTMNGQVESVGVNIAGAVTAKHRVALGARQSVARRRQRVRFDEPSGASGEANRSSTSIR